MFGKKETQDKPTLKIMTRDKKLFIVSHIPKTQLSMQSQIKQRLPTNFSKLKFKKIIGKTTKTCTTQRLNTTQYNGKRKIATLNDGVKKEVY